MDENPCPKSELLAWCDGRRIVDLWELSKQLHCKQCSSLLDLQRTEREARYGLASVLYILCNCGEMNDVHTGRTLHRNHRNSHSSDPVYEVNVKAAENLQMYEASASCILSFLALLDVPVSGQHDASLLLPATLQLHTPPFPTHIRSLSQGLVSNLPPAGSSSAVASLSSDDVSRRPCRRLPTTPPPSHASASEGSRACESEGSRACESEGGSGFRLVPSLHRCDGDNSDDGAGCDDTDVDVDVALPAAGGHSLDREDKETVDGGWTGGEETKEGGDKDGGVHLLPKKVKARARNSSHAAKKSSSRKACADKTLKMLVQKISFPKAKVKAEPVQASGTAEENGSAKKEKESSGEINVSNTVEWFSSDSETEISQGEESDASWHDGKGKWTGEKRKRGQGQPKGSVGKVKRARKQSGAGVKNSVSTTEEKERAEDGELNRPHVCAVCGKSFHSVRGHGLHMRRVHGQEAHQDQQPIKPEAKERVTGEEEEEEEAETREFMQEVTGQLFRCPRCPAVFSDPKRFFGHSERRHPGLEAEEKGKLYPVSMKGAIMKKSLVRKDGSELASYRCVHCGSDLPSAAVLGSHLRVTEDDRLSCVVVSPLGVKVRAKTLELSIGRGETRPCLCSVCGKVYANPSSLSTHVKEIHAQKKKFCCQLCSAAFSRYGSLQYHLGTHQENRARPCVCATCGKSFFTAAHLKHHARNQHRNAPPLLCHVCGKAFFTTRTLKDHALIHTGHRPFPCAHCPMTFYKKYNLTVHQRIHSGHKPYRCPLCPLAFAQKHSLDYHMTKHGSAAVKDTVAVVPSSPDSATVHS